MSLKKQVCLMLFVLSVVCGSLVGCGAESNPDTKQASRFVEDKDYFIEVHNKSSLYSIVYDRETKVMYVMSRGMYNGGTVTPLYNTDGSLKLYTGGQGGKDFG